MTYTSTEDPEAMRLVSKRRKDIAAWAVENFKTWPKPHELTDVDPEEIGCELVVLNQHHLPVLRCKLGGGYVDSTTWFYAKRNPKKMTQAQQPEALRLAHTLIGGKLIDDSTEWADTLHAAAAELRRQHARIAELEAQLSAICNAIRSGWTAGATCTDAQIAAGTGSNLKQLTPCLSRSLLTLLLQPKPSREVCDDLESTNY